MQQLLERMAKPAQASTDSTVDGSQVVPSDPLRQLVRTDVVQKESLLQLARESATAPEVVDVFVEPAPEGNPPTHPDGAPTLSPGISEATALERLAPWSHARVLRLSHAHGLLCGITDGALRERLSDSKTREALRPPTWCSTCFQKCASELSRWLDAATIARGADGPTRWCSRFETHS